VTWSAKECDEVTEIDETTDSTSTEVFVLLTIILQSATNFGRNELHLPMVTALTFPLIITVVFLQPNIFTVWLISAFSTVRADSFSWYSYQQAKCEFLLLKMSMWQLTINHLLPSNKNLAGFFPASACGLEGLIGFLTAEGSWI